MRRTLACAVLTSALALGLSSPANAQTEVVFCDGCSPGAKFRAAIRVADGPGRIGVGDRNNGELVMYRVHHKNMRKFSMASESSSQRERDEFFAYSDAYRHLGGSRPINVEVRLPDAIGLSTRSSIQSRAAKAPPEGLPGKNLSGFDLVSDGPLRERFMAGASDIGNWPGEYDAASFYAKVIVSTGKSLHTGADFQIAVTFHFRDGSYARTYYQSETQRLQLSEVRDSTGNLIYTESKDEVAVDYSSYMWPGAFLRPDYARGIDFLRQRGVVSSRGEIRRGTVLVKDAVVVRQPR